MTERAIDKMVEWLEKEPNFLYTDYKDIRTAKMTVYKECIDKARRLSLEEAKEKPMAPTSLVEKLEAEYNRITPYMRDSDSFHRGYADGIDVALGMVNDCYRPSTQANIVGELKAVLENKWMDEVVAGVQEIIRKHEGAICKGN